MNESSRVPGRMVVIPLVIATAVVAAVFLNIQLSGRGAKAQNYLNLSYTAGLRDLDEGFYADAVKNLTPMVEAGDQPAAHGFRGEAYLRMKHHSDAEADFREAVQAEPGLPANHAGLGATLAAVGKHEEALAEYDSALRLHEQTSAEPGRVRRTGDTPEEVRKLRAQSLKALGRPEGGS